MSTGTHPLVVALVCLAVAPLACIKPVPARVDDPGRVDNARSSPLPSGSAQLEIQFENAMPNAYVLEDALFEMDGHILRRVEERSGGLAQVQNLAIFAGSVPAGEHVLRADLRFQGNGYGQGSYLRGYRFTIKSSHALTTRIDAKLGITVISYEQGSETTPLEQRLKIAWHERLGPGVDGGGSRQAIPSLRDAPPDEATKDDSGSPTRPTEAGVQTFTL